jgi:hypothetical protein
VVRQPRGAPPGAEDLTLWAESPEEARTFVTNARAVGWPLSFDRIFVAKRSGKSRSSAYVDGEYYQTTDDSHVDVLNSVVQAPPEIVELVQWCTCDVMISRGPKPLAVFEDTTHIVRMNLYQRIPRLARAASLGIPAVMLQGTQGLNLDLRGDRWALHRYLQAFDGMARAYPESAPVVYWHLPVRTDFEKARASTFGYLEASVVQDEETLNGLRSGNARSNAEVAANGFRGDFAPSIPSIKVTQHEVRVKIGAKPERKSWREKGSGQMDPYVGMIAAAKYIYCFDESGVKSRPLVVEFTYLPPDFFFFKDYANTNSLYKKLPFEFGDSVEFLG